MSEAKITQSDLHLFHKELEAQGEFFNQEKLERMAEMDNIRMELESIKQVLEDCFPDFHKRQAEILEKLIHPRQAG